MKQTYVIDDELFRQAVEATGIKDPKLLIEKGIRELIEHGPKTKAYWAKMNQVSKRSKRP